MKTTIRKPWGLRARRRTAGDSFAGCLFFCVLLIGGVSWAYFHFFRLWDLDHPLEGHHIVAEASAETTNTYRLHVIRQVLGRARGAQQRVGGLYRGVKDGSMSEEDFRQESFEVEQELLESIKDMKSRSVPKSFEKAHLGVSGAIGEAYKTLDYLRQARQAEQPEPLLEQARAAWQNSQKLFDHARGAYGSV
ncbi:MAG: hypothetical protein AB7S38_13355 [Vulcanimicrobiota bacterium]